MGTAASFPDVGPSSPQYAGGISPVCERPTSPAALHFDTDLHLGTRLPRMLGSWDEGLLPGEAQGAQTDALVRRHADLWMLTIDDLRSSCSPLQHAAWLARIPSGLLARLQRGNLNQLLFLFLLRHHPELEGLLQWPSCLRQQAGEWMRLLQCQDRQAADAHVRDLLSRPRRELFWAHPDATPAPRDAQRYGRLMLAFAARFPGRYADRSGLLEHDQLRLVAPLLPAFFNCRGRFRQKLRTLRAFAIATRHAGLTADELAPLFYRCLKQGEKVRPNNLALTLERLRSLSRLRDTGHLAGLLRTAPNARWLEKRLRRMERKTWRELSSGGLPGAGDDADNFPGATLRILPWVEPLRTNGRVVFEGIYMQNCIASYTAELATGRKAAYALAWPERCTVLLERKGDRWVLQEARAMGNLQATPATLAAVQAWLEGRAPDGPDEALDFFPRLQHGLLPGMPYWAYLPDARRAAQDPDVEDADDDEATSPRTPLRREPSLQIHLPEQIARWRRLEENQAREDYAAGFAPCEVRSSDLQSPELMVYVHPDCPHLVACIPYCSDPAAALCFVRVKGVGAAAMAPRPLSLRDMQHQQALREELAALLAENESAPDD